MCHMRQCARSGMLDELRGVLGSEDALLTTDDPAMLMAAACRVLYFNRDTWTSDGSRALAESLRVTLSRGLSVLLVHETDPEKGGVPFSHFFDASQTPAYLIGMRLYGPIAAPLRPSTHSSLSLSLLALHVAAAIRSAGPHAPIAKRTGSKLTVLRSVYRQTYNRLKLSTGSQNHHDESSLRRAEAEASGKSLLEMRREPMSTAV
eukprot:509089-Prymnesium_polylepis.1